MQWGPGVMGEGRVSPHRSTFPEQTNTGSCWGPQGFCPSFFQVTLRTLLGSEERV